MERRQIYVLVGMLIFMSGLFKPFHFWAGPYDSLFVLLLTVVALLLAWRRIYRELIPVIIGAVGSLAYTIVTFRANMAAFRTKNPGIETIQVEMIDWAIPLAGISLVLLAVLVKSTRPPPFAIPTDPTASERSKPKALAWLLAAVSTLLPLLAIGCYAALQTTGYEAAIYGISVAIAASFWELGLGKRLLFSIPVAILGLPLCATFDVLMILGVALAAGAFAVGYMPTVIKRRWWANLLYRLVRLGVSGGSVILTASLHLPNSGQCPGGGGDITGAFATFAIMTYLPIGGMIAMDSLAKFFGRHTEKLAVNQSVAIGAQGDNI